MNEFVIRISCFLKISVTFKLNIAYLKSVQNKGLVAFEIAYTFLIKVHVNRFIVPLSFFLLYILYVTLLRFT